MYNNFIEKHRDYLHPSVWSHLRDAGAKAQSRGKVPVRTNPITEEDFDEPQQYWQVEVTFPDGKIYMYLMKVIGEELTEEQIEEEIQQYTENPVDGGRFMIDYIEIDVTQITGLPPGVVAGGFV